MFETFAFYQWDELYTSAASAFRTANLAYSLGLMNLKDDALEHILNYGVNSSNPSQDLNELLDDA